MSALDVAAVQSDLESLAVRYEKAVNAADLMNRQLHADVVEARRRGLTWQQVADALGISRQAAWKRFRSEVPVVALVDQPLRP